MPVIRSNFLFWLYTLVCQDGSIYTGITTDTARRLHEHNHTTRGAKYTRSRRPVVLLAQKEVGTKSDALKLEWKLKKMRREQKLIWIKENMELVNCLP